MLKRVNTQTLVEWMRLSLRLPLFIAFLLGCVATVLCLRLVNVTNKNPIDRTPFSQRYLRILCHLLGFSIRLHGRPTDEAALLVSNHISWTDIAVLGSCRPLRFLAKSEVAHWPVIGWIARDIGTLFIKRGGGQSGQVRNQISDVLRQNESVLVFPEGTTTDGTDVLPFHGRLLMAARDADKPLQAMTVAYQRDGQPDLIVPFIGDDRFEMHLIRLFKKPAVVVDVVFHPPVTVTCAMEVDELARLLHGAVCQGLHTLHSDRSALAEALAAGYPTVDPADRLS